MNDLIFKVAGKPLLIPYAADGTEETDTTKWITVGKGIIDKITPKSNKKTTSINDGNSQHTHDLPLGLEQTIAIAFNSFSPVIYAAANSSTISTAIATSAFTHVDSEHVITKVVTTGETPVTTYEVDLDTALTDSSLILIRDAETNTDYEQKESATGLTAGDCYVDSDTGLIEFAAADNGKSVYITYTADIASVETISTPDAISNKVYKLIVTGVIANINGTDTLLDCLIFDRVVFTDDVSAPERTNSPGGWTVNFKIQPPRAGHNACEWKTVKIA